MLKHTTELPHCIDGEQRQSLFIRPRLCPMPQPTPATAGRMGDHRAWTGVTARVSRHVPTIHTGQLEVTGVRPDEQCRDAWSL